MTMTLAMRALVVREYGGKAEIVELSAPEVGPGRILVNAAGRAGRRRARP